MELQPQTQQEKESKTLSEKQEDGASGVVEVIPAKIKDSCSDKPEKDDGGSAIDSAGPSSIGDPGPSSCSETTHDTSGKEEESFPSVFISHASINISGSNPDISESEKLRKATARGELCCEREGSGSKGTIDSFTIPQRVVVHRVCSDSRIGEGEGFHSSKLAFYTADGSFSSSLKALGLSVNNGGGSRGGSMKNKSKPKQGSSSSEQLSGKEKVNINNVSASSAPEVVKKRSQTSNKGCDPRNTGADLSRAGESSGTSSSNNSNVCGGGVNKYIDILPPIEQSISESKTEHPSTSEGEETLAEDVVDDEEEELLDEYDEPSKSLDCQLDFDAAVTELLLRPEKKAKYKDSATWTQEDDMPSPLSDLSPVASPRRKKESNRNFHRELDRETGHSHNSLLEQYHHYLLEQQQHKQPQVHRHTRGGSGSKSGGSGSQHHQHHHPHHTHHSAQHHSHQNPKSSIVGIHQGNLKSQTHSSHHQQQHQPQTQLPLQAECFTVSSQLLSREAKLYENVPATQGELETLEILLASGGSGDSNYPPSGGSGSGGGASNTTASTSNTSGTSGQSHKTSSHGNNLNNNHNTNNGHHRSHHHHHQQQPHHHHHHLLHQGYVHGQHSHSATNLNTNTGNSAEQLFSVSDFLGSGGGLSVGNNNGGGPPSRTSWADSGRESLSFDGENNNSTGSTRNLLLIPPPPPPPINYLASTSTAGHSGFNSSSMMHPSHHSQHHSSSKHHSSHHSHHHHHHHSHSQAQSSESPSHHHNTKRSRRERLVRQKHAIDDTIFPSHGGSDKIDGGGEATLNSALMAVPSPRRGLLPGSMQASNFVAAAASPINLQRHPPASQIMLQENKKNGPLIPCESPYGIMAGGPGTVGTVDWPYPETFGENLRRNTNKSHLTGNILRSRSPQRGRGIGSKGNNSSFDYGELPSHQMFPKRHLLTSRQFSGHHRGYSPGASGTMQNNNGNNNGLCPPTGFQPMQHRSFPAGVFSGATPRSCSMGDLTSSAASLNGPNGQGHHHSNHHSGKSPERLAISSNTAPVNGMQSSTVPLVTSLPLPPATSVTYEFSLAPVSGTLAPGWHLTAVQRGLATAVPLAAAVARRRLPRPRTARPRFGFTDKNEARRAKWTIVITALALLAMSMLLVGVTLRLAPLIDDLACDFAVGFLPHIVKMDVSIQTDPVDPQEIWNILIQHHKEQENSKKVRHSGGVLKHYQQNPDAIQLAEGDSRFEVEMLQRNFNNNPPKVKPQTPTVSPARSSTPHYDIKSKESRSEQSLSDRICHVVWRRKVSSPSVTPLGSKRVPNSVRRGTAPNVPPFSLQKPDVFGRSQSFKGSSSSGSFKNRAASHRDPLSRRASGSALATAASVALSQLKAKNNKLSPGCTAVGGLDYGHNNLGQNEHSSLNSSIGSGQNLSSNLAAAVIPLERKLGAGLAAKSRDGDVDMRRQISMTLSIPSREDSVRSYASSKSYVSFSAVPTSEIAGGQMKPSMKKLVRYGSNPDVFSSHRTRQRDEERESFYLPSRAKIASCKSLASCDQERSRSRSNSNIGPTFSGGIAHSTCLSEKKKQILSQKQKRNEKVAWAVHLGFSSLLILAIACIVVFLRLSSTVPPPDFETTTTTTSEPVRKENENLLQSIQPQLNLQNLTTPQPTTNSVQIANQDTSMDKSIVSLQSGQSLTRSKVTSSINDNQGETGDEIKSNKTTNANLDVSDGSGGENSSSFNRSNNDVINSDNDNPSLKSNSDRPKRSRPRSKLEDGGEPSSSSRSSSIIINVLNEKVSANDHLNDTPGLAKTRHLESSLIRFLKNTSGQERRERRNLESGSRNL